MKVLLLAYKGISSSEKYYLRLKEELENRFEKVLYGFVDYVTVKTSHEETKVCYKTLNVAEEFDAILPRFGPSYAHYGEMILEHLKGKVFIPNKPRAYSICNDKFRTLLHLQRAGVPIPESLTCINQEISKKLCGSIGEPIIIKKNGLGGKGVVIAQDVASANSIIDALELPTGKHLVIEEFIDAGNEDYRFFVVGDQVVASMKRVAKNGEVRSNLANGGRAEVFKGHKLFDEMAVMAARAVGAGIAGVDMMIKDNKPYVLEVNMNPGFKISEVTNENVFSSIAEFMHDKTKKFLDSK